MITVLHDMTIPAIDDDAESRISGFFVRAIFNGTSNMRFSIINYSDPIQYSANILETISHSVCKMNGFNFENRVYCYADITDGETLLQMPSHTSKLVFLASEVSPT